jgi:hypothetical protein
MPQVSLEHMVLALKVLSASYGVGGAKVDPVDVTTLKSYLGDTADRFPADQIASLVIQRELERLKALRGAGG